MKKSLFLLMIFFTLQVNAVDDQLCPEICTDCTHDTCIIDCSITECANMGIVCPTGWNCVVNCTGADTCKLTYPIECPLKKRCDIICNGTSSCQAIIVMCNTATHCKLNCVGGNKACMSATFVCPGPDSTCEFYCHADTYSNKCKAVDMYCTNDCMIVCDHTSCSANTGTCTSTPPCNFECRGTNCDIICPECTPNSFTTTGGGGTTTGGGGTTTGGGPITIECQPLPASLIRYGFICENGHWVIDSITEDNLNVGSMVVTINGNLTLNSLEITISGEGNGGVYINGCANIDEIDVHITEILSESTDFQLANFSCANSDIDVVIIYDEEQNDCFDREEYPSQTSDQISVLVTLNENDKCDDEDDSDTIKKYGALIGSTLGSIIVCSSVCMIYVVGILVVIAMIVGIPLSIDCMVKQMYEVDIKTLEGWHEIELFDSELDLSQDSEESHTHEELHIHEELHTHEE